MSCEEKSASRHGDQGQGKGQFVRQVGSGEQDGKEGLVDQKAHPGDDHESFDGRMAGVILVPETPVGVAEVAENEGSAKRQEVGEERMNAQSDEKEGETEVEPGCRQSNQSKTGGLGQKSFHFS